jgi:hypothetical protein
MDHDLATIAFGVLALWRPPLMTTPELIARLATWHAAVKRGCAMPCLFCQRCAWDTETPAALVYLRDVPSIDPQPICETCDGRFPDDETLADVAMVAAKYRWWPVDPGGQRVYVDQETTMTHDVAESGEPKLIEIGQLRLG